MQSRPRVRDGDAKVLADELHRNGDFSACFLRADRIFDRVFDQGLEQQRGQQGLFSGSLNLEMGPQPLFKAHPLPSLLLQPLVENAIKYAVSPQEAGAEITIAVQLVGQNLRITVSDTGPGLQSGSASNRLSGVSFDGGEPVSTGVGLANIRDRLVQAYAEEHRFETMEPAEGGFTVLIELPFERRETEAPAQLHQRPVLAG